MSKVTIFINGKEIITDKDRTILDVARENKIFIPTLCYLKDCFNMGKCGMCMSEVQHNGKKEIVRSCSTLIEDGMKIETESENVLNAVKWRIKDILSNHDFRCFECERQVNCELSKLAFKYQSYPDKPYSLMGKGGFEYFDNRSKSISINRNKCIKCGRCEAACNAITTTHSINLVMKDGDLRVEPTDNNKCFDETNCLLCGQCVIACPVNALTETKQGDIVKAALKDPKKHVIAAIAPSVRASIGELFGMGYGVDVTKKLYTALRKMGFDKVFDLNFGADMTIVEEATELVERVKANGPFPMFTSCCPAWIREAENFFPELLPNISSTKSPQEIFGAATKTYYPEAMGLNPEDVFTVTIMPCIAKKFEASREEMKVNGLDAIDAVLTAREFAQLIKDEKLNLNSLEDGEVDQLMGEYSGAGAIFGATGGVMEAAIRTAKDYVENADLEEVEYKEVRGFEGIREATVKIGGMDINVAVISGSGNVFKFMKEDMINKKNYHFIEVMACPGGCINGGGQPHVNSLDREFVDYKKERASVLYNQDSHLPKRKSHKNGGIIKMYKDYVGEPGNELAHKIFHVKYTK